MQPTRAFSPASIGKGYLRSMGIRPVLERQPDFPEEVLAAAMSAYYGGRAECRIRKVEVPVTYVDFLSMYATVNALMGLWRFVVADRIEVEDATDDVRRFLRSITLDDCFRAERWPMLTTLVQISPKSDVLPVRAGYEPGGTWNIGVNPLSSERPLWFALADVVASTLLTGRAPEILRAIRLVAQGQQPGLRPVSLRGEIRVDPSEEDFFRVVIEERHRVPATVGDPEAKRLDAFLKVLANAASYGIYAEIVRHELSGRRRECVRVFREDGAYFVDEVGAVEEFGEFAFPPMACFISAGARLMLAMLERAVTDAGGSYVFCDTDSMAIVSRRRGGRLVPCPGGSHRARGGLEAVRALTWDQVDQIVGRFEWLNPFDRRVVPGSILELEDENLDPKTGRRRELRCLAISAKRYALFNRSTDGDPAIRKHSEHGLGHLVNPTDPMGEDRDWIRRVWERILGSGKEEPSWFMRAAIGRITVSSPHLLRPFKAYNEGRPPSESVRPFSFLLSAQVAPFGHLEGIDPSRFHLAAPFELDPDRWHELPWTDVYSGKRFSITTDLAANHGGAVSVRSYSDVVAAYTVHPEAKSLGPDGRPCRRGTIGLLSRRPVRASRIAYIGKESNRLEDVEAGMVHQLGEVLTEYRDPDQDPFDLYIRPVMAEIPARVLAAAVKTHPRKVAAVRNGHARPRAANCAAYITCCGTFAKGRLREVGVRPPLDDAAACRAYLAFREYQVGPDWRSSD